MKLDKNPSSLTNRLRAGTAAATAPSTKTTPAATGFEAAQGLRLPSGQGRGFNPVRSRSLGGLVAAMSRKLDSLSGKLAVLGPVCKSSASENPSAELYHHLHGGQPFVFSQGTQPDRVIAAAVKAAGSLAMGDIDGGPTRLITWSSAQGWQELYPQDGTPVAYDADGSVVPFEALTAEHERSGYNPKPLQQLLYGSDGTDAVNDIHSPMETLQAVDRVQCGDAEQRGRVLFCLSGMGPHLRQSLDTAMGDGRVYQQLLDMRPRMESAATTKHILFNDGPMMAPAAAAELGQSYSMPLPTERMMASSAFGSMLAYLYSRPQADTKEFDQVSDKEIAAFRAVVGPHIKEAALRGAVADGITPAQFEGFLPEGKSFADLTKQLVGFTTHQAKDLMGEAVSRASMEGVGRIDFDFVAQRRFDMLKQNFNIELVKHDPAMPKPQGLDAVMDKLGRIRATFQAGKNRKKPVHPPKMMLLAGVPGMGKSLVAKSASSELGVPLVKLDLARLFNKFVGESESNFARMFEVLESLAPAVVWIDEIEKALGGTAEGSSSTDGGVTDRVHGLLLTWLEEHKDDLLIVGTCNEPDKLSSALLSRAPVKYFVGYQEQDGLSDIWKANLDALTDDHGLTAKDLKALAAAQPTLTGREIAHLVNEAREVALVDRPEADEKITKKDIDAALKGYVSDYAKNPMRAQLILAQASNYESASGKPIVDPGTGQAPVAPAADPSAPADKTTPRNPRGGVSSHTMDSV